MIFLLEKKLGALRPGDGPSEAAIAKLKDGQTVRCEVKRLRSPRQHRLYFALCQIVLDNTDKYSTVEDVSDALKCGVGHCHEDRIALKDAVYIRQRPKSIAFGNMPQDQFNEFFNKVLEYIDRKVIPGIGSEALRNEVEAMVAG